MAALETLLGRAYNAKVMSKEPEANVIADFQTACADPDFENAARAYLAMIDNEAILVKDFVSRVFKDFLTRALGA